LSNPLPASGSIPPARDGIAIFTCVRLASKLKEVKREFCGRMGKSKEKAQSHRAAGRNQKELNHGWPGAASRNQSEH